MIREFRNGSLMFRHGINYNKTRESQDEKNSMWHSMMSNEEAENGMTEKDAMLRGLKFGWDNIFAQEDGEDLGKLGQGLHALQDAMAHNGMRTNDHLGFNLSSIRQTLYTDMYGSQKKAEALTRTAMTIIDLINGKKANVKDGDKLLS